MRRAALGLLALGFLASGLLALGLAMPPSAAAWEEARAGAKKAPTIEFQRIQLDDKFRSEGAAVGDFNRDGKLDISAGFVYYAAPDWKLTPIVDKPPEYDPMGYSNSFCNFADDLNGDGWTDLIVVDFPGVETWWFENPQSAGGAWTRRPCVKITNNESPAYLDLDGDGQRELIFASALESEKFDGPDRQMGFARRTPDPNSLWTFHGVSAGAAPGTDRYSHGLGVGDVNRDGKQDILTTGGWWEAPEEMSAKLWQFHAALLGEGCANMYVEDLDGDGDNDVVSSAAHKTGIWWHEQTDAGWQTHLIAETCSQTHSLCFADIDGDGDRDLVTGKRWWAHGPKGDDAPDAPALMCWFEYARTDKGPTWTPHVFDRDSGVGTQFEVADVNGDGLLDVATSNKKGANLFLQVRK